MSGPELKDIKDYQALLNEELKKIEQQIYDEETKYLEETASCGTLRSPLFRKRDQRVGRLLKQAEQTAGNANTEEAQTVRVCADIFGEFRDFPAEQGGRGAEPMYLSLIHICRCRRIERCRSRWSPYH
eukprot:TRINITY_DN6412_c0_g1_i9.p1 TRINITY_DN6412_c0_g1~~TRINITY_DN6412_c0_g1_i9.p1  ORF type:complete len:128 (-),score=17.13 TRINITY_DN6412_c0_g1_i9:15-398(-)